MEDTLMNEDRLTGDAKRFGGQVDEGLGRAGAVKTELEGKAQQAAGAQQEVYGKAKEAAASAMQAVRESASEADDFLRTTIEQRPLYRRGFRPRHRVLDRPLLPSRLLIRSLAVSGFVQSIAHPIGRPRSLGLLTSSAIGFSRPGGSVFKCLISRKKLSQK
jgi:uncharacterized protein YjbJ (UPF0337 family)